MTQKSFLIKVLVFIIWASSLSVAFGADLGPNYTKVDSNVRLRPWYNASRIGYFKKGEQVIVKRILGQWCHVEYKNYQNAYIYCPLLNKVELQEHSDEHTFYKGNNYSLVWRKNIGTAYIDLKGNIVHYAYNTSEGPDDFKEGLTRYVENGKVGFINEELKVVILAQFDWASQFENGTARVCNECKKVPYGENYRIEGGTWGTIDKDGVVRWE